MGAVLGPGYQDRDLVFATTVGTPVDAQNLVNRSFKPLLKRAGLPNIRFHDLRHTCATLMLSQGVNPKVGQERLGHADIAMTMDTYSHVLSDMQEEAAATSSASSDAPPPASPSWGPPRMPKGPPGRPPRLRER